MDREAAMDLLRDVEKEQSRVRERINKSGLEEHDNVYHPAHYEVGNYECIKVMEAIFGCDYVFHFCVCNAFKYLWRHKRKNGFEDLEKARWYLTKALELSENVTLPAKDAQ